MTLTIAVAASNGITITSSMVCCVAYLYKSCRQYLKARPLVATTLIITLTALTFGLQLAFPWTLRVLERDLGGLRAGQWWRLITPLFVQSQGTIQFVFNMMFLMVFLPMGERIFGAAIWLLYFVPGLAGQLVNYAWQPGGGGGSSTAIFGVMGSILMFVLLQGRSAPRQYPVFAVFGICGAVVMCFTHDGHGPALLVGTVLAGVLCSLSQDHRISQPRITSEDASV